MASFHLKLIAPDGVKYETDAAQIIIPTPEGQICVLPNHMPLIALLSPGEIAIKINDSDHHLATEGGVVKISNNIVEILADTAENVDSLDELKIEEARQRAQKLMSEARDDVSFANASASLEKQLAKLNVLKRRKKYNR